MMARIQLLLLGALAQVTTAYAQVCYIDDTLYLGFYDNAKGRGQPPCSIPGGTKPELIRQGSGYSLVRTEQGIKGWVKAQYLVSTPPASVGIKVLEGAVERVDVPIQEVETLTQENTRLTEQPGTLDNQLLNKTNEADNKDAAALQQSDLNQQGLNTLQIAVNKAVLPAESEPGLTKEELVDRFHKAELQGNRPAMDKYARLYKQYYPEPEEFTLSAAWNSIVYQLHSIGFLCYCLMAVAALIGFFLGLWVLDWSIRRRYGGFRPW